ncbi:MotA/TolQ/ExbB proton channel family protein [Shewanella psychrotolerans]|uniref:MotA/TolQ/ExbB proton channel family protein n=1 Tax=Shewanella psychrotolerans TaxID=2864206 RepID=UPI001C6568D5|nr:MotA/TolQ/ExbB proton channel family protein [Shewanella psychrotolerans]QYK00733.1 MotA/TolQ/ExbB proton channel family protein [Shewanella psychrotolerans]
MFDDVWSIGTAVPLILCSIVTLALVADRCFSMARLPQLSAQRQLQAMQQLQQGYVDNAAQIVIKGQPFYAETVSLLLSLREFTRNNRDEQVSFHLRELQKKMKQRLSGLITVATLAPMLGLLGTIIGLMRAFHDIGKHQGPVEPAIVADGLWQALSTTAVGLIIAVVCVLAHALLAAKARHALTESTEILNRFSHALGDNKG